MNNLFYNPPLFPLRKRGFSGIHFLNHFFYDTNWYKKNQKINSSFTLHWMAWGGYQLFFLIFYLDSFTLISYEIINKEIKTI